MMNSGKTENTTEKTDNQIIKNLQYKVMKFFRKFNKVIPKMVAEEIEKRES